MYDSYYYDDFDAALGGIFIIIMLIGLVLSIVSYVISSLIYYKASKINGFSDLAYIAWIPIINVYSLFLLTAKGEDNATVRGAAKKNALIYVGLIIVSFIPLIGIIASLGLLGFTLYFTYRLFYRWTGETGKAILYIILSFITFGLFYYIYGLMKMNKPFVA
ncbi:hypothetical protein B1B04_04070 [Lysinibacillus sp. KCTC 33748]|uniref:hypothetical protein n=1 Tax=unclassified Lysinibacillus TaxID=2636778 RepID=UPI0009A84586|nr:MULTISPECIES: hypothetical protein [unclassified Lysinibacillus]OXS76178.1 hypothetical protein B1B04_04070 [Lysinibacillus sp. KCTC 33748]SKB41857.1 hypothetical protein SAMN06295926_102284 [Lysinibacillus sp. AC-3]